jgi:hypothetical protein
MAAPPDQVGGIFDKVFYRGCWCRCGNQSVRHCRRLISEKTQVVQIREWLVCNVNQARTALENGIEIGVVCAHVLVEDWLVVQFFGRWRRAEQV